ncbi:MAG: hypothetical protein HC933_14775 [Pleurocapsa sp. SU_196_0]|nr:hypothetical protein [Pleurocapsa sp. SU_196_0]
MDPAERPTRRGAGSCVSRTTVARLVVLPQTQMNRADGARGVSVASQPTDESQRPQARA